MGHDLRDEAAEILRGRIKAVIIHPPHGRPRP